MNIKEAQKKVLAFLAESGTGQLCLSINYMCVYVLKLHCTRWQHRYVICIKPERYTHCGHIHDLNSLCIYTYTSYIAHVPDGNWTSKVTIAALTAKTGPKTRTYSVRA